MIININICQYNTMTVYANNVNNDNSYEYIFANKNINKSYSIYINIDNGLFVPEYILYRACKSSNAVKNKIIKSTKKMNFSNTNNLVPIKYNYIEFFKECEKKFGDIYFVTNKNQNEYSSIMRNLNNNYIPKNIDIVSFDKLCERAKTNNIIYLDAASNNNDNNNFILYKVNILN